MAIEQYMAEVGQRARAASRAMAKADTQQKNHALALLAQALDDNADALLAANEQDLEAGRQAHLDAPLMDRLAIGSAGVQAMATGVRQVAELPDPVGQTAEGKYLPSGIHLGKMRVPLGVVGIIYESRPNVTVDAAILSLKSGNACILRGGSEAFHSNQAIAACVTQGLEAAGLPGTIVQLLNTTDRSAVGELLKQDEFIDVIVPRGGKGLIERISAESRIPVIKHLDGICHVYIDDEAEPDMAVAIAFNSKAEKLAVCNALETLLIHQDIAQVVLPRLAAKYQEAGIELRGCARAQELVPMTAASEADWAEEYLGPILAVRVVDGLDQGIEHINQYGSQHTDVIVTENYSKSRAFIAQVDSASVMVNASTQFADGFEYGLGAEVGISTDKIHARGPVGLEGLTSQKYVVFGSGEIRHR